MCHLRIARDLTYSRVKISSFGVQSDDENICDGNITTLSRPQQQTIKRGYSGLGPCKSGSKTPIHELRF